MYLKSDFLSRLEILKRALDDVLKDDEVGSLNQYYHGLFPALYSVFTYLWSNQDFKRHLKK